MENLIEGDISAGKNVVVIEDLISTGGSSLKAVDALRKEGCQVLGMAAIFTYGFQAAVDNFVEKEVTLHTLSDYQTLIEVAVQSGYVSSDDVKTLSNWRNDPAHWGK